MTTKPTIPPSPTLRDVYQLVAITAQQMANYAEEIASLREEVQRGFSHQTDNVRANRDDIDRLERRVAEIRIEVEAVKAWQAAHQFTCPLLGNGREVAKAQIATLIRSAFSKEEMNDLAFQLGLDTEEIAGDTAASRSRYLVQMADQRGLMNQLLLICQQKRPHIAWPMVYD